MLKAETERKKFILQKIPSFSEIPPIKFDEFYRKVIALFVKKNEIIYSDKTKTSVFYLIYQGTCKLQKNFLKSSKQTESILDMKLSTIMNLEKGDVTGLESLFGSEYYNYTLLASSSEAVLFKIDLNLIAQEFRQIILPELNNIYNIKRDFLKENVEKSILIKEKMRIKFRDLKNGVKYNPLSYREECFQQSGKTDLCHDKQFNLVSNLSKIKISKLNISKSASKQDLVKLKNLPEINSPKKNLNPSETQIKFHKHTVSEEGYKNLIMHSRLSSMNSNISFSTNIEASSINNTRQLNKTKKSLFRKHIFEENVSISEDQVEKPEQNISSHANSIILNNQKEILTNLRKWKSSMGTKSKSFNTGTFMLPLFALKGSKI